MSLSFEGPGGPDGEGIHRNGKEFDEVFNGDQWCSAILIFRVEGYVHVVESFVSSLFNFISTVSKLLSTM